MSIIHGLNNKTHILKYHIISSNAPALVIIGTLPLLTSRFSLTLEDLGLLFFLCRIFIFLGSYINKYLLNKFKCLSLIFFTEIASATIMIAFYYTFELNNYYSIVMFICIRSLFLAFISNSRNVLFKQSLNVKNCENLITFNSAISQLFYIFAGIIYIYDSKDISIFKSLLIFDVLSSILSSLLIYKLKAFNIYIRQLNLTAINKFSVITDTFKTYRFFVTITLLFGIAFGGSDILCYTEGFKIYKNNSGYGYTTIIFSIAFYLGYKLTSHLQFRTKTSLVAGSIIATLLLKGLSNSVDFISQNIMFLFLILVYGYLYICLEKLWINVIAKENSSRAFALKDFIFTLSLAFGELIYSHNLDYTYSVRISILIGFLLYVLFYKRSRTNQQN